MTLAVPKRDPATFSRAEAFMRHAERTWGRRDAWQTFLDASSAKERDELFPFAWEALWARPSQLLPPGNDWRLWMIRAGRGFGKTRAGAEGVRRLVNNGARAGTIIGRNPAEARDVMVEGPSGIIHVHPPECRPKYESSKRLVSWPNGALAHVRSAEDPDSLRGLNSEWVWGDEPASWRTGREPWDQAMLGNRLGNPRAILTGTPRPLPWLKELEALPTTRLTVGNTYENMANLADAFVELILARYENTRLGAQELHALYLEDVEGALWTASVIEQGRLVTRLDDTGNPIGRFDRADPWTSLAVALAVVNPLFGLPVPDFTRERRRWETVVGVDPPGETAECGIIVATAPHGGQGAKDHAVVLDDRSLAGTPEQWGAAVVKAYKDHRADLVVVESNQGGDMVRATIHAVDPTVNVEKVRAKDSKLDRAEPVSTLYAKGWVHHLGMLPELESQMTTWVPTEGKSPDRIDALVHAITHLTPPAAIGRASFSTNRAHVTRRL